MTLTKTIRLTVAGLLLAACTTGGGGAAWTYAPLGPTANPSAEPTPGGSPGTSPGASPGTSPAVSPGTSPGTSPGASPDASPGASAGTSPGASPVTAFQVSTPAADPLAFVPPELEFSAATSVTVTYLNDSPIPHNINFFAGPDNTAPSLGATEIVTGPGVPRDITFTTPDAPGDYYFWCDVHLSGMDGIWRVTE